MKFTVAHLLDQLPAADALPVARLEKALGLSLKPDKSQLRIALEGLSRLGVLVETEDGIQRRQDDTLIEARLRCSSKGFCFALREDGGEDIYIRDHQLNHAWNGDRVLVRITREGGAAALPKGVSSASSSGPPLTCSPRWNSRRTDSWPSPSTTGC
ncbi:hypothetical protein AAJV73_13660 [Cyanobium sp. BSA11S]|uniref:hypothetical protein n=1 Tax=Cyanobium sp. BSA11S TaxID=3108224 RepID=UPI003D817AAF